MTLKPVPAIVQQSVDLNKLTRAWESACGQETRAEKTLAEVRLEKGRLLVEARKAFPARGPKAKGWGELLERWGLNQQTAWKYMALAGYVADRISPQESEIVPTYAEAGIVRRPTTPRRGEEVVETYDDEDDEPDTSRAAYLIRADQAMRFAVCAGSVDKEMIRIARQCAQLWSKLANEMEKRL
jgi:hypothetical protein